MKKTTIVLSLAILLLLLVLAVRNDDRTEYVKYQVLYRDALRKAGVKTDYPIKIRQLVLSESGRIDRCVSCHVGMEDPRMADAPKPLKTHPGKYLKDHDVAKVGCTSCHDGQGRAIVRKQAHANLARHWEHKRLYGNWVQSACVRCHSPVSPVMMPQFVRGRKLFLSKGCLGCHQLDGKGGRLGPDLTTLADASPHLKRPVDQSKLEEKFHGDVNAAYIFESIMRPKAQPHDSKMLNFNLKEDEAMAIAIFLKSLSNRKAPVGLQADLNEYHQTPDGKTLFGMYCAACHGTRGEGRRMREFNKIAPAIGNQSFLAIADEKFIAGRIADSGKSLMPAWSKAGGLSAQEVNKLAGFVYTRKAKGVTLAEVRSLVGNATFGHKIFRKNCSTCHGLDGNRETDMIGPTLSSPDWLTYADDKFIHNVLQHGRKGTAMPRWAALSAQDCADLQAFFRRKREPRARFQTAMRHVRDQNAVPWGRLRYQAKCMSCHGDGGSGGIGPSLNSKELQSFATDEFLFTTIVNGRKGTAMGAHWYLHSDEAGWIIAYLRSLQSRKVKPHFAVGKPVFGREGKGAKTFARICAQCHGPSGSGHIAPAIGNPAFLKVASDSFIKEMAAYGRSGTGMKGNLHGQGGTSDLSEPEINDVVAYLRSLADQPRRFVGIARTQGDIKLGRTVFARICAQCHGIAGGGGTGPGIGRKTFLAQVSDGFLEGTIANGRSGTEMRAFTKSGGGVAPLSNHEIRSVVRYLRSGVDAMLRKPKVATRGPALAGKTYYLNQCAPCHGPVTKQSIAPYLFNPAFLRNASDSYIQGTMSLGRPGTAMRSMLRGGGGLVEMTSKQANDTINYLRKISQQKRSEK